MKSPYIYLVKPLLWDGRYHETFGQFLNVGYEKAIELDAKGVGYAVAKIPDYVEIYRFDPDLDEGCLEILENFFRSVLNFPQWLRDESWERIVSFIYLRNDNLEQLAAFMAGGPVPPKEETKPKRVRKKKPDAQ